jgi:hypothetical protein
VRRKTTKPFYLLLNQTDCSNFAAPKIPIAQSMIAQYNGNTQGNGLYQVGDAAAHLI